MQWDLSERTEDAFEAYLKSALPGDMRVYSAWDMDRPQFPCAVVHVAEEGPLSDEAAWHDARKLMVEVAVMTEIVKGDLEDAREINAKARSPVMDALYRGDLNAQIVAQQIDDIAFSMAQATTAGRSVDGRVFVTTINVEVIAEPVGPG